LGNLDKWWALVISIGIFVIAFSTIGVSYQDSHCTGMSGEEMIKCKMSGPADDSGGVCEGLSSYECLQKAKDTDGDGLDDYVDLCPNEPETFNGFADDDGCPDDLQTLTPDEIKQAYDGLTNKFQEKVPEPILDEFQSVELPTPVEDTKLDTRIFEIQMIEDTQAYAQQTGLDFKENFVRVLVTADNSNLAEKINQVAIVETSSGSLYQVKVSIDKISELSNLAEVQSISPLKHALQTSIVVSEGVESMNVVHVPNKSLSGKNVKIAVFDKAFDIDNEEIKNNIVQSKSFRFDDDSSKIPVGGYSNEYIHGTSVVEIIIDVAPDVDIFLYTFDTRLEFLDAVSEALKNDVDLMTTSTGWISSPTDGKSPMTQKIEEVINQEIPFVISAGNYAETHWSGDFSDEDEDKWHEFALDDEGLSFDVNVNRVIKGIPLVAYLMWDNTGNQQNDFDLTLTDPSGNIVATSSNIQDQIQQNVEYVYFVPEEEGTYSLGISYQGSLKPSAVLEIFSNTDKLEYSVPSGSVNVPTDAKGAFVVGAIRHDSGKLEPYSSQGPTKNGKQPVPNLVAPSGVTTLSHDKNFSGTSAAAPHVAGLIALLLESNPNLTPSIIAEKIQSNTDRTDILLTQSGYDNIYGYGKANATFLNQFLKEISNIPTWIKNNAGWWADGAISDEEFVKAIEFLINKGILSIPDYQGGTSSSTSLIITEETFLLPKYPKSENINISGNIDDYKQGTDVNVIITKPDGEIEEHRVVATRDGNFNDFYKLDHLADSGSYHVTVQYQSSEFDILSFRVVKNLEDVVEKKVEIPDWLRNNAKWWSESSIKDSEFVTGIQFLISNGIMNIK